MDLVGRLALVTGASRGIGAALAEGFATAGAHVVLLGRDETALHDVAGRIGGEVVVADLADRAQVDGLVQRVEAEYGPLEILVNNAGVDNVGSLACMDADEVEAQLRVNLLAPVEICRQAVPGMVERRRGHVVNVSSLAAFSAFPGLAVYGASKAGLTQFTAGLRADLRGTPVGTTVVELGPTSTSMMERAMDYSPTGDSFRRLYRWRLIADVPPHAVAVATVEAVRRGRRHVRLPRRTAIAAQLAASPRRTTEWLLTGVSHQQDR